VPTQVLAGRDDRLFPVDFQRRVARERLGIEADEIGGGHLVTLANRSSWSSVSRPIEPPARCGNRHTGRVVEPPFVQQRDAHTRETASGSGRIRAGGDEAYHAKYDSYWFPGSSGASSDPTLIPVEPLLSGVLRCRGPQF